MEQAVPEVQNEAELIGVEGAELAATRDVSEQLEGLADRLEMINRSGRLMQARLSELEPRIGLIC